MSELITEKKTQEKIWMDEAMRREIGELMEAANAPTRSEFVRQAVRFYCGYLHSRKAEDFLTPMVSSAMKAETRSLEHNLSEMLFKLAVEVGMGSHVIAAYNDVPPWKLEDVRRYCSEKVAQNNGILSFEEANRYQNGAPANA